MRPALASLLLLLTTTASAQWTLQQSNTTADLRGIHALPNGIAWASGTHGTVLHTTDNGTNWLLCPTPPGAESLDFRGIQAFDANTAIVMSSGKGDLSRLYKTTDSCKTWKLAFTNPDPEGFWDALQFTSETKGMLIGDPVRGVFPLFSTINAGKSWHRIDHVEISAGVGSKGSEALFAASNSNLFTFVNPEPHIFVKIIFVTGGLSSIHVIQAFDQPIPLIGGYTMVSSSRTYLPSSPTAGGFSLATQNAGSASPLVLVGGDYQAPESPEKTASSCVWTNTGLASRYQCDSAITPPHGFRSAVAYSAPEKTWITVGPNGTDVSHDDGRNWQPLNPQSEDSQHWNALSLPYVVGPHGRIGLLRPEALTQPTHH